MPKELGMQPPGMNRRDFLKTAPVVVGAALSIGAVNFEGGVQAQEKVVDNHIHLLTEEASNTKIVFPDKFETVTPQVESLISVIQNYQLAYLGDTSLNNSLLDGGVQKAARFPNENDMKIARAKVWAELRRLNIAPDQFSEANFYRILMISLPAYLARYGIYVRPKVINLFSDEETGKPARFLLSEFAFTFLDVAEVKHDQVAEWRQSISRDLIYIKGSHQISGRKIGMQEFTNPAENSFLNIMVFPEVLRRQFEFIANDLKKLKDPFVQFTPEGFLATREANLEESNTWRAAVEVLMVKLVRRMKEPVYEEYEKQKLSHEDRHWIDRTNGNDIYKTWPIKVTTNQTEAKKRDLNFQIHDEINPTIAELKYGPNREFALIYYAIRSWDVPGEIPALKKVSEWVIRNMVDLIDKDPRGAEHYGIEITGIKVNRPNQILSKLDMLLDRPKLFDELCDKLIELHRMHLADDLIGAMPIVAQQDSALKPTESTFSKLETPAKVVGAATLLGLGIEALRRRRNKVAEEGLSRQQKRRKKNK